MRAVGDRVPDAVTLKIARIGGVTRTAQLRDVAVDLGLHVTVEDTGGSDIDTAAIAHLSLSTPARAAAAHGRLQLLGDGLERDRHAGAGRRAADGSGGPGLGVDVLEDELGEPFLDSC